MNRNALRLGHWLQDTTAAVPATVGGVASTGTAHEFIFARTGPFVGSLVGIDHSYTIDVAHTVGSGRLMFIGSNGVIR